MTELSRGGSARGRRTAGDDRELAILATAERLLAERPLSAVSVDDLARGAGIPRPTSYSTSPRTTPSCWRWAPGGRGDRGLGAAQRASDRDRTVSGRGPAVADGEVVGVLLESLLRAPYGAAPTA